MSPFEAYHGISSADHQRRFDDLSSRGFRMVSLSVYGPPSDARYAAIWVQLPGPAYIAFHGRNANEYQGLVNVLKEQGYAPVLLSVTGGAGDAIFAGVFEELNISWRARHGISAAQLDSENALAAADGLVMRELCCYENPDNPLFAAIWHENPSNLHASWWRDFDAGGHQQIFNAVAKGGGRPYVVITSDGSRYHSIFQDDEIGSWTARHGINEVEYQGEFNGNLQQGRMPFGLSDTPHLLHKTYTMLYSPAITESRLAYGPPPERTGRSSNLWKRSYASSWRSIGFTRLRWQLDVLATSSARADSHSPKRATLRLRPTLSFDWRA